MMYAIVIIMYNAEVGIGKVEVFLLCMDMASKRNIYASILVLYTRLLKMLTCKFL